MAMDTILTTANNSLNNALVYVHRPTMPLKLIHLMTLRRCIDITNNYHMSHHVIYHHLRISTHSPLIFRDRPLYFTLNNTIYHMIARRNDTAPISHYRQLSINPHNNLPYLRHTCEIDERTIRIRSISTNLPSTWTGSTRPRHHLILRTTSHDLDLETRLIFLEKCI